MYDVGLEQVTKKLHTVKLNLTGLRNELKKLLPVEKMSKDADFKTLQQHVSKLWTQQQRRIEHVVELQDEADQVIRTINAAHEWV